MTDVIKQMQAVEVVNRLAVLEASLANIKMEIALAKDTLTNMYADAADSLFKLQDKQSGDITFVDQNLKLKASISKTIKWDSAKLRAIASVLDWPTVEKLFDIEFSVPEARFNALTDDKLRAQLVDARTVKYGALTITPAK